MLEKDPAKRRYLIIIGILVALIVAGAAAYFLFFSPEKRVARELKLGQQYLKEEKYEDAVVAFNAVLSIDKKQLPAYEGLMEAHKELGQYDEAINAMETAIQVLGEDQIPDSDIQGLTEVYKLAADDAESNGDTVTADLYWSRVGQLDPDDEDAIARSNQNKTKASENNTTIDDGSNSDTSAEASDNGTADLSACYSALADYVSTTLKSDCTNEQLDYNTLCFSLLYLDDDDYPELVYANQNSIHADSAWILCYKNGQVTNIGAIGEYSSFSYFEKKNVLFGFFANMGLEYDYYYAINDNGGTLDTLCSCQFYYDEESRDGASDEYKVGENDVSKEEYDSYVNNITGGSEQTGWSSDDGNHYSLNSTNIEKLRNGEIVIGQ